MEIQRTITVNLSPEELAEIIKEHLAKEGLEAEEKSADFKVSSHLEGYGYGEHEVLTFKGCSIVCKIKTERK